MPASRDELFQRFADLGIKTTTKSHAPVFTVEEARLVHPDIPGGHCKNLFCKDEKGVLWLIVCLEDCPRRFEGGPRKNRLTGGFPSARPNC